MAEKVKRIFITGANTGIGFEAAKALGRRGHHILLGCRDAAKGEAAKEALMSETPQAEIDVVVIDLADLASVRECASKLLKEGHPIDVLLNNAGVMACPKMKTVDGFEYQVGVNHLGHFLLTLLLLPLMKAPDRPARIINVSSIAHRFGTMDFSDFMSEKKYARWSAYGRSKLANIMFTRELSNRLPIEWAITANSLHPGAVATELQRHFVDSTPNCLTPLVRLMMFWFLTPEQGAQTSIYLADSPEVEGVTGKYYVKCKPAPITKEAQNDDLAKRLWNLSLELTKCEDPIPETT